MLENFFCLILAGLLLIGFLAWRETSQSAWRDFAQQNGLKFSASPFDLNGKVAGEYRGRRLLIDAFLPAGKAHPIIVTRLEIAVRNPNNIRLYLLESNRPYRPHLWSRDQDIRMGDAKFDSRFEIGGQPLDAVMMVLASPVLRQKLLSAQPLSVQLSKDKLLLMCEGLSRDSKLLLFLVDLACDLANAVDG